MAEIIKLIKPLKPVYWLIALVVIAGIGNWQFWQERKDYLAAVNKKTAIEKEINNWEGVLAEKKFSKEVLLKLAWLNYLIYQDEAARDYWQRAHYLDPTFVSSLPVQLF